MIRIPYLHDDGLLEVRDPGILKNRFQIFSHQDLDGTFRHYDVAKLWRMIDASPPGTYETRQFAVTRSQVDHIIRDHGIELDHLARIKPSELLRPGLIIEFPDTTQIVIDGNHRYVKLFALGETEMTFYVLTEEQSLPTLLAIPPLVARVLINQ